VPNISPKKTVACAIGGLIGAMGLTVARGLFIFPGLSATSFPPLLANLLIGFVGGVTSQIGDLCQHGETLLQGQDFGSLFPGHGGMLARKIPSSSHPSSSLPHEILGTFPDPYATRRRSSNESNHCFSPLAAGVFTGSAATLPNPTFR
jgi:hypothetical protein